MTHSYTLSTRVALLSASWPGLLRPATILLHQITRLIATVAIQDGGVMLFSTRMPIQTVTLNIHMMMLAKHVSAGRDLDKQTA